VSPHLEPPMAPAFHHSIIPPFLPGRVRWEQKIPNKPNSPKTAGRLGRRRGKCAKRTQFPASWPAGAGRLCKTNPIWEKSQVSSLKPERRAFKLARYPKIPILHHSTIPIQCQSCKTNPISGAAGREGTGATWGEGKTCKTNPISGRRDTPVFHYSVIPTSQSDADRAKQSQFRRQRRKGKYRAGKELW